ncbi:hypothetical protein FPZ12_033740 [Amycolatopsis acidicola]|uniref:Secreted protein n=1 Tax=Amycolatopsis acidicola TaxID=2596893 RepID=A0A5N0UQZ0_9PSEU|nr:hypothetical protein [Amycolatopsis acidicola]KAA9153808.1 hypothetical protein FPZ12_033740 [Amycolatopsis acidicola]
MRIRMLVPAAVALAVLTACGSKDGGDKVASLSSPATTTSAQQGGTDEDKALAYAKCMREHGVNMPDPETGGGGIGITIPDGTDKSTADAADAACKSLLPNGGTAAPVSAEDLDKQRKVAQCLREHGVDVPDPTAEDPGIKIQNNSATDQDKVRAAMEACQPAGGVGGETHSNGAGK